jgi:DNA-binding NarL/FixJ family response regulator
MNERNNIRILLVEDQPLCRLGVRMALTNSGFGCVLEAEAEDVQQAIAYLEQYGRNLDLILLDYALPDGTGKDVIDTVKRLGLDLKIVMLSGEAGGATIQQLLDSGINGFMSKDIRPDEIGAVLASVMQGHDFTNVNTMRLQQDVKSDMELLNALTRREMDIISLCATGKSAKQIAEELNISTHTVENHKDNIFSKIGVKSTSELILFAFRVGLVS